MKEDRGPRTEDNAYGEPNILDPDYTMDSDQISDYGNNVLFTGRRVDILDNGSLKIQYNRNRYYSYSMGRWLTHDPLGITPEDYQENPFDIDKQYTDGLNLYDYVTNNPTLIIDAFGLRICKDEKGYQYCINAVDSLHELMKEAIREAGSACRKACDDAMKTCIEDCPDIPVVREACVYGLCIGVGGAGWLGCVATCGGLEVAADAAELTRWTVDRGKCTDKYYTHVDDCEQCPPGMKDLGTGDIW